MKFIQFINLNTILIIHSVKASMLIQMISSFRLDKHTTLSHPALHNLMSLIH